MKKVIFAVLTVAALTSCGNSEYIVKLSNGSVVRAIDDVERGYAKDDTLCVVTSNRRDDHKWLILSNGMMVDSTWTSALGVEYITRVGIVQAK